jgi:hypothetical protein
MKINLALSFVVLSIVAPAAHAQFTYTTHNGTITITALNGKSSS